MPWPSNADMPASLRTALPDAALSIFREAFESEWSRTHDESKAMAAGWSAVKTAGYRKGPGTKWVHASGAVFAVLPIDCSTVVLGWER